ncbi:Hypothetical predicted protein [Pelobates cultripes]|uniref:Uncharacterized protein n=1 Tax=Pelobates cultripes TaxID=61616 RepID=A0AAD1SRE2_PELCU|nr:Hypothetical predicted protein [Pelobates cultripes]
MGPEHQTPPRSSCRVPSHSGTAGLNGETQTENTLMARQNWNPAERFSLPLLPVHLASPQSRHRMSKEDYVGDKFGH